MQFTRFLIAGALAASANFGSRFLFSSFFSYGLSVFLAYLIGMLVAFLIMRGYVFRSNSKELAPQLVRFAGVNLAAMVQTVAISLAMARWALPSVGVVDHSEALGHFVGVLVPVGTSYLGHKFLTFR